MIKINFVKSVNTFNYFLILSIWAVHFSCSHRKSNSNNDSVFVATNEKVNSNSENPPISESFSIINVDINNKIKTVASIRIQKKLPEDLLRAIAIKAKSEINPVTDRVYLFFLLPEMKDKNGAWARADFNPELEIYVLGQTIESDNSIKSYKANANEKEFIGQWTDNNNSADLIYRMRNVPNQGLTLELFSPLENKIGPFPTILKKVKRNGNIIYIDTESPNQYYIIDSKGDLKGYDEQGYIVTYKKL